MILLPIWGASGWSPVHSGDTQVSNLRNREIDTQAVLSLGGISELCGGQVILRMSVLKTMLTWGVCPS